jgi:hypothetical protein
MMIVTVKTIYGGHISMFGVVVDIPAVSRRHILAALPNAPVFEELRRRHARGGRARRRALGSRRG